MPAALRKVVSNEPAPPKSPLHLVDLKDRHGSQSGLPSHGIFPSRRSTDAPAVPQDTQELSHIKKLLSAQETARQAAQNKVMEVSRQLKVSESENNRVRVELRQSRNELAATKQENTFNLRQSAEREAALWNELVDVRGKVSISDDRASGYRRKMLAVSLVLAVPAMLWAAALYGRASAPEVAHVPLQAVTSSGSGQGTVSDFSSGVGRLNQALDRFRNEKAEDVLKRVHAANAAHGVSVCSFEWNNGEVSLVFGGGPKTGIGTSMAQCADAVEKTAQ